MATTDPSQAHRAVAALFRAGETVAILHGEDRLARGEAASDIDLVSAVPARNVVSAASPHWAEIGLHPIIFWPYDVGGTATVFLATAGAEEGVQLDILHDVEGRGQYGFRSATLLEFVVPGQDFPRLEPVATSAYVARKRQVKGEIDRPDSAVSRADARMFDVAGQILTPGAARELLTGKHSVRPGGFLPRIPRLMQRLARPVGAWVDVTSEDEAEASRITSSLAERLRRILPHVASSQVAPSTGFLQWWAAEVAPVRWRAGVFLSWSGQPARGPDISIVTPADVDDAARRTVAALRGRIVK